MRRGNREDVASRTSLNAGSAALEYVQKSIRKLKSGEVKSEDGSWLEGIFGKAARRYEQWAKQKLSETLCACALDYGRTLQADVPGTPRIDKLSLGQVAWCFERIAVCVDQAAKRGSLKPVDDYLGFCGRMSEVNKAWKDCVKHGYVNLDVARALEQLGNMETTLHAARW